MTVVISIPLGILAAVKHDRAADSHAEPLPRPSGRGARLSEGRR